MPDLLVVADAPKAPHGDIILEIVGHSDNTGAEITNQSLSQRRANRVVAELTQLGFSPASMRARGVATSEPLRNGDDEESRQMNRSVTIRVLSSSEPLISMYKKNLPARVVRRWQNQLGETLRGKYLL